MRRFAGFARGVGRGAAEGDVRAGQDGAQIEVVVGDGGRHDVDLQPESAGPVDVGGADQRLGGSGHVADARDPARGRIDDESRRQAAGSKTRGVAAGRDPVGERLAHHLRGAGRAGDDGASRRKIDGKRGGRAAGHVERPDGDVARSGDRWDSLDPAGDGIEEEAVGQRRGRELGGIVRGRDAIGKRLALRAGGGQRTGQDGRLAARQHRQRHGGRRRSRQAVRGRELERGRSLPIGLDRIGKVRSVQFHRAGRRRRNKRVGEGVAVRIVGPEAVGQRQVVLADFNARAARRRRQVGHRPRAHVVGRIRIGPFQRLKLRAHRVRLAAGRHVRRAPDVLLENVPDRAGGEQFHEGAARFGNGDGDSRGLDQALVAERNREEIGLSGHQPCQRPVAGRIAAGREAGERVAGDGQVAIRRRARPHGHGDAARGGQARTAGGRAGQEMRSRREFDVGERGSGSQRPGEGRMPGDVGDGAVAQIVANRRQSPQGAGRGDVAVAGGVDGQQGGLGLESQRAGRGDAFPESVGHGEAEPELRGAVEKFGRRRQAVGQGRRAQIHPVRPVGAEIEVAVEARPQIGRRAEVPAYDHGLAGAGAGDGGRQAWFREGAGRLDGQPFQRIPVGIDVRHPANLDLGGHPADFVPEVPLAVVDRPRLRARGEARDVVAPGIEALVGDVEEGAFVDRGLPAGARPGGNLERAGRDFRVPFAALLVPILPEQGVDLQRPTVRSVLGCGVCDLGNALAAEQPAQVVADVPIGRGHAPMGLLGAHEIVHFLDGAVGEVADGCAAQRGGAMAWGGIEDRDFVEARRCCR